MAILASSMTNAAGMGWFSGPAPISVTAERKPRPDVRTVAVYRGRPGPSQLWRSPASLEGTFWSRDRKSREGRADRPHLLFDARLGFHADQEHHGSHPGRMLMALAITSTARRRDTADWSVISIFDQCLIADTSVGLNTVETTNSMCR